MSQKWLQAPICFLLSLSTVSAAMSQELQSTPSQAAPAVTGTPLSSEPIVAPTTLPSPIPTGSAAQTIKPESTIVPGQLTGSQPNSGETATKSYTRDPRAHLYVIGLGGVLMLGGSISWKFSQNWTGKYKLMNEGFFQKWTYAGGADKLGHMYTDYVFVRIINSVYLAHGYDPKDAIFYSWLNGSIIRTVMEIADGFTTFQASAGDVLFNMLGSTSSALLLANPALDETFNLSWTYLPSQDIKDGHVNYSDFSIDYSGMIFTLDTNLKGARHLLGHTSDSALDNYQIGINYRTRYFKNPDKTLKQRIVGMSLGLNLEEMLPDYVSGKRIFKYVKVPFTFGGASYNIDKQRVQYDFGLNYFY